MELMLQVFMEQLVFLSFAFYEGHLLVYLSFIIKLPLLIF